MAFGTPYPVLTVRHRNNPWDTYRKIFGEMKRNAGTAIQEQAQIEKAEKSQSLISRGLYNTSVLDAMRHRVDRDAAIDLANQAQGMTGRAMGLVGTMTPEPAMTPRAAEQLGFALGMSGNKELGVPDWFRKHFGRISRGLTPQSVRLGG